MTALPYTISQQEGVPQVTHIHLDMDACPEAWFLLRADAHHDNAKCCREVEMLHLRQAVERNAGILDCGDLYCAMEGKYDKRSSRSAMRPENNGEDYLDRLVSRAIADYTFCAPNWVLLAPGNHEDSIGDRCGVNLTKRLAEEMRRLGSPVQHSTYQGWVQFHIRSLNTRAGNYKIRYTHGYGGGGPVTEDSIQLARQLAFLEDVDMVISGHTHHKWHIKKVRERLDDKGVLRLRTLDCLKLGTYKDEFSEGRGWAVGKGMPPKPMAGWWLRFYRTTTGRGWGHQVIDTDVFSHA